MTWIPHQVPENVALTMLVHQVVLWLVLLSSCCVWNDYGALCCYLFGSVAFYGFLSSRVRDRERPPRVTQNTPRWWIASYLYWAGAAVLSLAFGLHWFVALLHGAIALLSLIGFSYEERPPYEPRIPNLHDPIIRDPSRGRTLLEL